MSNNQANTIEQQASTIAALNHEIWCAGVNADGKAEEHAEEIAALKEQVSTLQAQLVDRDSALHEIIYSDPFSQSSAGIIARRVMGDVQSALHAEPAGQHAAGFAAGLEAAADHIDGMNDSAGDRAAYDQRDMDLYELERMHTLSAAAAAIRALASQPAAPVQPESSANHPAWQRAIYYTDTLNGQQVCRDDLWAITTQELSALTDAAPPVQQPDDVREKFEAWAKREGQVNLTRMAGDPDQYDDLILRANYKGFCAALATTRPGAAHPDDIAVDRFAEAMKAKMAKARSNGRGGWEDKQDCPAERLQAMMCDHLAKGDPVDVGNFAMMLFNRDEPTAARPSATIPGDVRAALDRMCQPLDESILKGATAEADARSMAIIKRHIEAARPGAALTETQQRGLMTLADRIEQSGNALPLFIDTTAAIAIRAILAASGGAEQVVPEGWQPIETAPEVKGECFFCQIAWGPEGDQSVGEGLRWQGRWFAAGTFYALGQERRYEFREIEVTPTHWMRGPAAPALPSSAATQQPAEGQS